MKKINEFNIQEISKANIESIINIVMQFSADESDKILSVEIENNMLSIIIVK